MVIVAVVVIVRVVFVEHIDTADIYAATATTISPLFAFFLQCFEHFIKYVEDNEW